MMTFDDIRKIVRERLHGSNQARKPHGRRRGEYDAFFNQAFLIQPKEGTGPILEIDSNGTEGPIR